MTEASRTAVIAEEVTPRKRLTVYPEPFASRMVGREKRQLGNVFGLSNFGVNLTRLKPGGCSSLRHAHANEDEFIYVLEGRPTLITGRGETSLQPGMCAGFAAGTGDAHHLVNRTDTVVAFLEIGTRTSGDTATYPDDDIQSVRGADGKSVFLHKDGSPY